MLKFNDIFRKRAGFTLVEMLVTLALLAIVASITGVICLKARSRGRAILCLDNQREISTALVAHYQDHREFPADGADANIAVALQDYIPWPISNRQIALPSVYRCLNDRSSPLSNSYESFYVRRRALESGDFFVLGCPRHADADAAYLNMLGMRGGVRGAPATVLINGKTVSPEAAATERTIASGTIAFEDGSSAEVTNGATGYELAAVASFRQEDGRLYTVVRVNGSGETSFKVTPGSKFEVVTPVAIIGVRGTQFRVGSEPGYASVSVSSGVVHVWDKVAEKTYLLEAGEETEIGKAAPKHLILEPDANRLGYWIVRNEGETGINFKVAARDLLTFVSDWYWTNERYVGAGETVSLYHPTAAAIKIVYVLPDGTTVVEISKRPGTENPVNDNIQIAGPLVIGKDVYYEITNNNSVDVYVSGIAYQWNPVAKKVKDISLHTHKIYTKDLEPDTLNITSGWTGDADHRLIVAGDGKKIRFHHEKLACLIAKSYSLDIQVSEEPD